MQPYKAVLAHFFGRGAQQSVRTALFRLVLLGSGMLAVGLFVAHLAAALSITHGRSQPKLFFAAALALQITVLVAALASLGLAYHDDILDRLLVFWPMHRVRRWALLMLPRFILTFFVIALAAPAVGLVTIRLGMPWYLLPLAMGIGVASALGMVALLQKLRWFLSWPLVCISVYLEYRLATALNNPAAHTGWPAMAVLATALLEFSMLFVYSSYDAPVHQRIKAHRVYTQRLPWQWWTLKKGIRRPSMRIGWGVTCCLAVLVAVLSSKYPLPVETAGILAAALAADVRSMTRARQPAECTALKGTAYFLRSEILLLMVSVVSALTPMTYVVWLTHAYFATFLAIIVGMAAGFLASTYIVPAARDILGQFVAALLAVGVLMGLPHLPILSSLSIRGLQWSELGCAALFVALACAIEYKRNPYYWRSYARTQS